MSSNEHRYKWASPYDWLSEQAATWTRERLLTELRNLAVKLDSDTLQDEYQTEMDSDGFFEEIHDHTEGDEHYEGPASECPICERQEAEGREFCPAFQDPPTPCPLSKEECQERHIHHSRKED